MRRRHLPLALLPLLAACAPVDPTAPPAVLGGLVTTHPLRSAALSAPQVLGDTSRFAGNPAAAARAAVHMEFIANGFETDPLYAHEVSGPTLHQVRQGRSAMRGAIGIAPEAPAEPVIAALSEAAAALEAGSPARAEAALSGSAFGAGGAQTLTRLAALPDLPAVNIAAMAANNEIMNRDRNQNERGGRRWF